jgi:hypothetical protein
MIGEEGGGGYWGEIFRLDFKYPPVKIRFTDLLRYKLIGASKPTGGVQRSKKNRGMTCSDFSFSKGDSERRRGKRQWFFWKRGYLSIFMY